MDGEVIQKADPHIGLLHRGTEKLAESQAVQPVDRLHGPARLRVDDVQRARLRAGDREACSASTPPLRAQYIRVMFDEITRILNHLMWLGAHGLDIGAMTVFLLLLPRARRPDGLLRGGLGHAHARDLLPPGRRLSRPAGVDAEVPARRSGAAQKDVDAHQRGARGLAARFHRRLHASASRRASTSTKRCSPTTASGSSAR